MQLSLLNPEPPASGRSESLASPSEDLTAPYLSRLNPAQKEAVEQPLNQDVRVLAGAGTGKTELIARRFVKLVKDLNAKQVPMPQNRILVVTFTNEAASSMRQKIHQHLLENGEEGLEGDAWVSTFHQFANRLLRAHGLRIGLAPQFDILDTLGQRLLFRRLIESLLAGDYDRPETFSQTAQIFQRYGLGELPGSLFSLAHFQAMGFRQLSDVLDVDRLFRFVRQAKATGLSPAEFYHVARRQTDAFTSSLIRLPVNLPSGDDKPNGIAVLTNYMEDWQRHLAPWADTHWKPLQEVRQKAEDPSASDYKEVVKQFLNVYCWYDRSKKAWLPLERDSHIAPELQALNAMEHELIALLSGIYALYQHALKTKNTCDFDDLINHAITLLENEPDLRSQYQRQFEAMIVDEFQDSNTSQLRLLQLLSLQTSTSHEALPVNHSATNRLTIVGDEKQSIYKFRFAQPENLNLVFDQANPVDITLATNYRSYPAILHTANCLSYLLLGHDNQTLSPRPEFSDIQHPPVTWVTLGLPEEIPDTKNPETGAPKIIQESVTLQKEREAEWIAGAIETLVNTGEAKCRDIAILVKSHAKAELIQNSLTARQIPSIRRKHLGFFEEPVIKHAMALLQLMVNLHDELPLVRILQGKLNHRQLRLLALCRNQQNELKPKRRATLLDVLQQLQHPTACPEITGNTRAGLLDLAEGLLFLKQRQHRLSPSQLLSELGKRIGIIQPETAEYLKKQQRVHLRTLEKLLTLIHYQSRIQPTLSEIVQTLLDYRNDPNLELPVTETTDNEDAVSIMTVHAAKGLEFPVVFVAYCDKEKMPNLSDDVLLFDPQHAHKAGFGVILGQDLRRQAPAYKANTLKKDVYKTIWHVPQSRAEAQRLFYVAITRAQKKLYVLRSDQSPDWTLPPMHINTDGSCRIEHIIEDDLANSSPE